MNAFAASSAVFLDENDLPKIGDFGLANQFEEPTANAQTGAIAGRSSYMAPEQAGGDASSLDPTTDVYALGAILYETLTGRPPFRGPSVFETLSQVRERDPVPLRQLQPGVPTDLQTICLKFLNEEPGRRFPSSWELVEKLQRFLRGEPIRARPVGRAERARKWMHRKPYQAMLLGLAILIPTASAVGLLWHNESLRREVIRADRAERASRDNYESARETVFRILNRFESWNTNNRKNTNDTIEAIVRDGLAYVEKLLQASLGAAQCWLKMRNKLPPAAEVEAACLPKANVFGARKHSIDAATQWQRVVELAEEVERLEYRMLRALSLARGGDSLRAAAEAEAIVADPACTPDMRYNVACVFALPGRAEKAIDLLSKLQNEGYLKNADHRRALRADSDLDSLRQRDGFLRRLQMSD